MLKNKITSGNVYACHHGQYAGQLFAFICRDKKEQTYNFLRMPDMITTKISQKDFHDGIDKEIIKFVEKVPKYVHKVIMAQYKKNENTNDRRK
jgi:hypothetical protein